MFYEEFGYQYFTSNFEPDGFDCLRDKFIGLYHTEDNPIAVVNGKCSGSFEKGNNHCGSLQKNIILLCRWYDSDSVFIFSACKSISLGYYIWNAVFADNWILADRLSGNVGSPELF